MVDFALTPEQEELLGRVREYCQDVIEPLHPHEREWIEDPAERLPWEAIEEGSRRGLRTLNAPARFGGEEVSALSLCMAVEELAAADMGLAVVFDQTWKLIHPIAEFATPEQAAWFFPDFMADHRFLLAATITEPAHGTDKYIDPDARMDTTAVRDGDEWVLNGHKRFISNGSDAKLFLTYAQTELNAPMRLGATCFLLPADTPGVEIVHVHDKMSQRLVNNAEIRFTDVRIRNDRILGAQGAALGSGTVGFLRTTNAEAAATTLGSARAAYELALAFAHERVQGGRPIIGHQAVGLLLAEMATALEAARTLTWRAASAVDARDPRASELSSMAKVFAADAAVDVCLKAMEIFGGLSIMRDQPVQKYMRDCLSFLHSDGTQQMHKLKLLAAITRPEQLAQSTVDGD